MYPAGLAWRQGPGPAPTYWQQVIDSGKDPALRVRLGPMENISSHWLGSRASGCTLRHNLPTTVPHRNYWYRYPTFTNAAGERKLYRQRNIYLCLCVRLNAASARRPQAGAEAVGAPPARSKAPRGLDPSEPTPTAGAPVPKRSRIYARRGRHCLVHLSAARSPGLRVGWVRLGRRGSPTRAPRPAIPNDPGHPARPKCPARS